jgi:hypothetical protein
MASVLTKLTRRKAVEVIQAVPGKRWGRLYREKQNHDG